MLFQANCPREKGAADPGSQRSCYGRRSEDAQGAAAGGDNQNPGPLLQNKILPNTSKDIFVMPDWYDSGFGEMLQNPERARMIQDSFFYINMMNLWIKTAGT